MPASRHAVQTAAMALIAGIDFDAPSVEVARALIGAVLRVHGVGGRIVETEAYDALEPASHAYTGRTARNASLFGPPGHVYVYRSYGLHWCLNCVCREAGHGAGVLIRALEPTDGLELMQALGITGADDGLPLDHPPFELLAATTAPQVQVGARIGISKAVDLPWRFGLRGSRFVSRRFA